MKMRKSVAIICTLLIAVVSILAGCAPANASRFEGKGYATPEDAVKAYIDAMREWDVYKMASTFAIETYVDHVNTKEVIERSQELDRNDSDAIPATNEYARNILLARRYNALTTKFYNQYLLYQDWYANGQGHLASGIFIRLDNNEVIDTFFRDISSPEFASSLQSAELVEFMDFDTILTEYGREDEYNSQSFQRYIRDRAEMYGYDEVREVPTILSLGDEEYLLFMQCARYGDKWYNFSQYGDLVRLFHVAEHLGCLFPASELY